jgi:hypothetical protein
MNTKCSTKLDSAYQQFKKDCELMTFISTKDKSRKKLIKYKGKLFQSSNYQEVFLAAKASGLLKID